MRSARTRPFSPAPLAVPLVALIVCMAAVPPPAGACGDCEPELVTIEDGFGMLPADAVRQVIEDPPEMLPPDRLPAEVEVVGPEAPPAATTLPVSGPSVDVSDPEITAAKAIRTRPGSGPATRHYI